MKTAMRRKPAPILGLESAGIMMTFEEFDNATNWDAEYRYQLIHGVLVVTPPPLQGERDPNDELGYLLRKYQEEHPNGSALDKTLPEELVLTATSWRRADRVIWAGLGRPPDVKHDLPTITVEFVSKGKKNWRRDYQEKRKEYAEIGIAEYWLIDRFERIMTVYRNERGRSSTIVVRETQTYRTPLLPGFELPLARLLTLADLWKQ